MLRSGVKNPVTGRKQTPLMQLRGVQSVPADQQLIAPLFAQWSANQYHAGHEPGRIGASKLGGCSRALAYQIGSVEASDPMGESGQHATGIGTAVHAAIQERAESAPPSDIDGVMVEEPWSIEIDVSGGGEPLIVESKADLAYRVYDDHFPGGRLEVVDIKTIAPYGFRKKVQEEGPERGHLIQIGMAMRALGAVTGRLVLIASTELKGYDRITKQQGDHEFRANRYHEWVFDSEAIGQLVEDEIRRIRKVAEYMDAGKVVPRTIPGVTPPGAEVVDPTSGLWQHYVPSSDGTPVLLDQGTTWRCRYCPWQTLCASQVTG